MKKSIIAFVIFSALILVPLTTQHQSWMQAEINLHGGKELENTNTKPVAITAEGNVQPPSKGDWIINDTIIVEDSELIINGSILIYGNGSLILKNSKIYMNLNSDGQYRIDVCEGGNLTIINSVITAYNPDYSYYIMVYSGAKFLMDNSELSYAGYISDYRSGLWINTKNAIIQNSRIHDCFFGVFIDSTERITFINNTIYGCNYGAYILDCTDLIIANNTIMNNDFGIHFETCREIFFYNNTLANNTYFGAYFMLCSPSAILNNTFVNCGLFVYGNSMYHYSHRVLNNVVNNKKLYYVFDLENVIIEDCGQAIIAYSEKVMIRNLNLSKTYAGIIVMSSSFVTITNNTVSKESYGIYIERSINVSIHNNKLLENPGPAIFMRDAYYVNIFSNTMTSNTYSGVYILSCSNIKINDNIVSENNYYGMNIKLCSSITVSENIVTTNNNTGVYIDSSSNTTLKNNLVSKNNYGIYITSCEGIVVVNNTISDNWIGVYLTTSSNITVFLNNFVNNVDHAYDDGKNKFDNGFIGNYWSNYNGTDDDENGIGDTPYYIDDDSIDNFPLVNPVGIIVHAPFLKINYKRIEYQLFALSCIILAIIAFIWYRTKFINRGRKYECLDDFRSEEYL
ncbi:MAG: NosD domain-containing protein [Candidatus Asgardarchaeia archaeon]